MRINCVSNFLEQIKLGKTISTSYRRLRSAIWEIFSKFLIFYNLFYVSKCNIQNATLIVQYGKCYTVFCRSDCRYFYVFAINTIKCTTKVFYKAWKNSNAVNYFRKKFHLRCLTGLWMRLWTCLINFVIICFLLFFFVEMCNCTMQNSLSTKTRRREGISSAW